MNELDQLNEYIKTRIKEIEALAIRQHKTWEQKDLLRMRAIVDELVLIQMEIKKLKKVKGVDEMETEEEKLNKKVATDIMKRELRNIKRMNKTPCETCDVHPAQLELTDCWDRNVRYLLCANCIKKLINYRLSPSEFKRLLEGGHLIEEFYLHEDFYDDEGNALQPQ